jgi:hypothetical protein
MADDLNAGSKANREFKNSVFTLLFDDEEAIRDISGALLGKKVDPDTKIEKTTLQNVLLDGDWRNDLSFLLDDELIVLVEHQSTVNKNMPLRMLHYVSEIYNHLYDKDDLYREKMMTIPNPVFIVLYNGEKEEEEYCEYRLSKMFHGLKGSPYLEVVVKVYNINKGHNVEMVGRSLFLSGYVAFVAEVRENNKKDMNREQAMEKAVDECIKKGILTDFLNKHKQEIVKMLVTEWDYERKLAVVGEEHYKTGVAEGRAEGRSQERHDNVWNLYYQGFSVEAIAKGLKLSEQEVKDILGQS